MSEEPVHPVYETKVVRAAFKPSKLPDHPGLQHMVGHEFVWAYVGQMGTGRYKRHMWTPANFKDIEDYFEIVDQPITESEALVVAESELDIFRVEVLDS